MYKFLRFLIASSVTARFINNWSVHPHMPFFAPACSGAIILLSARCSSINRAKVPVYVFNNMFSQAIGLKFFGFFVSWFFASNVVLVFTSHSGIVSSLSLTFLNISNVALLVLLHCLTQYPTVRSKPGLVAFFRFSLTFSKCSYFMLLIFALTSLQ